jgi:predicted transcriptional regulator
VKTIRVGIVPLQEYKQRTIVIARGEYKVKEDKPKVWFESIKSMAQIPSYENYDGHCISEESK